MKNQTYEGLEKYLENKRRKLEDIDQELKEELIRQRLLEEMGLGESSLSGSEVYSENESIQRSSISGASLQSCFIEQEIAKVKAYMRNQNKPAAPPIDPHQTTFRHRNRSKTSSNLDVTSKHHTLRESLREESQFELKTLPQQWINSKDQQQEIAEPEKTIMIRQNRAEHIEKRVIARQVQRQKEMNLEREAIRKQLIQQNNLKLANERQQIFKKPHQQINFPPQIPIPIDLSQTLKLQRTKQFTSILRQIQRSHLKAEALHSKIRKL